MSTLAFHHVEVYVFRRAARGERFLVLLRAPGRPLEGVWQPVTGRLRPGESILQGAAREVLEETGLVPRRWWLLGTVTLFADPGSGSLRCLPLFAAQVDGRRRVRLSKEHTAHRFVSARQAARLFRWDSQRAALAAVRRQVLGPAPRGALELPRAPRGARG